MTQAELLAQCEQRIDQHLAGMEAQLSAVPPALLERRPAEGEWSVAEVLRHVKRTLEVYYVQMDKVLGRPAPAAADHLQQPYKSGPIGKRLIAAMENPNKSFPSFSVFEPPAPEGKPAAADAWPPVVATYFEAVKAFRGKLPRYGQYDLQRTRFRSPVMWGLLQMRLGDGILEHVAHFERHALQVRRTLQAVQQQPAS